MIAACGGDKPTSQPVLVEGAEAQLKQTLRIGDDPGADANSQFSSILDFLVVKSGQFWVLDGQVGMNVGTPRLRLFDAKGRFVRDVGRAGEGPGEFLDPLGLAELPDGRVIVRSERPITKVNVYSSKGEFLTGWKLPADTRWLLGGADPIRVDRNGIVWLPTTAGRPRRNRPLPFFLRIDTAGRVVDSVAFPTLPSVDQKSLNLVLRRPNGETRTASLTLPFQPSVIWAWSPMGTFVTARTDQYRLNAVPWRPGKDTVAFGRQLGAVPISEGERRARRADLIKEVAARRGDPSVIPELATTKPILSGIEVADDGQFIVLVSRTASRVADEWVAPNDLDIFGTDGRYQGRIVQPDGFTAWHLVADTLWGIAVDADGVQSVRRYTVTWTARPPH